MNTHNLKVGFGRYADERWTRIPVSYLKWIINEKGMNENTKGIARAEMERRGTITPDLDVSGHAIDRASLMLRRTWHQTSNEGEGIHAWLCRMAQNALDHGERLESGKIKYQGMKFVFEEDGCWPVLKTIHPA